MPKNKQIGKKFLDEIFTEDGIKTSGSIYKIISFEKSIDRIESGSTVDGELHRREINVANKHGEAPAILASYDEQNDCFHRIDLVSLGEGAERLEKGEKREVIIGTNMNEKNKNLRDLKREDIEKLRKDLKELERKWKDGRGLTIEESDFIVYLKKDKRLEPSTITNLEKLRKEHYDAQKWLDKEYPKETRDDVEKLNILNNKNLEGSLNLEGFINLKEFDCSSNRLTRLDFSDCSQLEIVRCQKNNLTSLEFTNCPNITELYCNRNQLTNLDFLKHLSSEKVEVLSIANNNFADNDLNVFSRFVNLKNLGLEPLQGMANLEELDINDTYIDISIAEELKKYGEPSKDKDDERYLKKERSELTYLDISKNTIKGALRLELFTNLKTLNCCKSQLINLNLSDCPNLIELDCSNNELRDLYFLKNLSKLEHLSLRNNPELSQFFS
ncbi:327_t:CDS:2, partial [Racocetra persica]